MGKYETIFILNPELTEEDKKTTIDKVSGIVQSQKGEIVKIDDWGTRKMAYEVKKLSKGHYILLHFTGKPDVLAELERNFRLMDGVLKYQTVRLGPKEEKIAQRLAEQRIAEHERTAESEEKPEPQPREEKGERSEAHTSEESTSEKRPEVDTAERTPEDQGSESDQDGEGRS
jgi:small subunit ribosomal protein S6